MDLIYTAPYDRIRGIVELGYLNNCTIDIEVGNSAASNDFEVCMSLDEYDANLDIHSLIYDEQGSEYGGMVLGKRVNTEDHEITLTCKLWRGMLNDHIMEPAKGESYQILDGDANEVLQRYMAYDGLLVASAIKAGIHIADSVRYEPILSAMERILFKYNARIRIAFDGTCVVCEAVPLMDLSSSVSFDNDYGIAMTAELMKGYNHIIGVGQSERSGEYRFDLWRLNDGMITDDPSHPKLPQGLALRTYVYDASSVKSQEELQEKTKKEFDEMSDVMTLEMEPAGIMLEIGDIVNATERITGITMKQQITRKIIRGEIRNGISFLETEYKVGE